MSDAPRLAILANRSQGSRAVGGRLTVDADELRFKPNAIDAMTGGRELTVPLARITAVEVEPGQLHPRHLFSGGLRKRLAVVLDDGTRELFVVNKLDQVLAELREIVGS